MPHTIPLTGVQIDAALKKARALLTRKDLIEDVNAMTVAEMAEADVVIVKSAYEEGDGQGGMYYFDPEGTDADNEMSVLRPSDYDDNGPGVMRKM